MLPNPVLQSGLVEVELDVTAEGIVTVLVTVGAAQPLLSWTITLCEPLASPVKLAGEVQAAKAPPSRLQVYPGVPPEKVTSISPVPVLQFGSVSVPEAVTAEGMTIVCEVAGAAQLLLSLTTTLCDPAERPLKVAGEVQAANAPPSRLHVYPGVPPEKVTLMLPRPVLQSGSVLLEEEVTAVGITMVCEVAGAAHPLLSFTTTLCEPAERPLNVAGEVHAANAPPSRLH